MTSLVLRRLLGAIPLLFVVSISVFALLQFVPGDPALSIAGETATREQLERIRDDLGLDRPFTAQYASWLADAVNGDLGTSLFSSQPVADAIWSRLPATLSLTFTSTLVALAIGVPAGIVSAVRPGGLIDRGVTAIASVGLAIPTFWLGILLVVVFARNLGWFPPTGYIGITDDPVQWARALVLPSVALGSSASAAIARQSRSALVEVLQRDYITAARARGMGYGRVVAKHGCKNAAIPVLTVLGLQVVALLGGSVVIEQVFAIPGVGSLAINAVSRRDITMIQGVVVLSALIVVAVNLVIDVLYGYVNPKARSR